MQTQELSAPDTARQGVLPLRAPLLWVLLPFAIGLLAAWHWRFSPIPLTVAATGAALVSIGLSVSDRKGFSIPLGWAFFVLLATFLFGWSYGGVRFVAPLPDWDSLPPREFDGQLIVERVFQQDGYGRWSGIGRIAQVAPILQELEGQGVQFRLKSAESPTAGERLSVRGVIRRLPPPETSRSFEAYLRNREVSFQLSQGDIIEVLDSPPFWQSWSQKGRQWAAAALLEGSDKHSELRAILPAMLLGERQLLKPAQRDLFKGTGMMHLFAVSGLHVGLVALVIAQILSLMRLGARWRATLGLLALLLYVLLIGAPPSAVRAYLMVLFYWGSRAFLRQSGGVAALTASALAVLLWQPRQLFDAGAQLSYGIVAGILLYGIPLAHLLRSRVQLYRYLPEHGLSFRQRMIRMGCTKLLEFVAASLGAFFVALPLSLHFFGILAVGAFALNLLLAPLAFFSVCAGTLALIFALLAQLPLLGLIAKPLWQLFNHAGWLVAAGMQWTIDLGSHLHWLFLDKPLSADWPVPLLLVGLAILVVALQSGEKRSSLRWQLLPFATMCAGIGLILIAA